jgi:cytoskeletal protein RodZ
LPPFGDRLKKEREKRGITLDDVALNTKIGTRFLRALEEEHFDQLPGGIFNRGFVRAYARCVGLDEDQTIADYLLASGEVQPRKAEAAEPAQAPGPKVPAARIEKPKEVLADKVEQRPEDSGNWPILPGAIVGGVVVVVLLGLTAWHFTSRESSAGSHVTSSSSSASQAGPAVSTTGRGETASTATSAVPNSSSAAASFVVLIKASEDSWISISADGKPIFQDTLEASEQKSIEAYSEVVVRAGNLGGLDFWFNGKKLSSPGEEGEVRTLTFDTNGLRPPGPKSQPADATVQSP